MTVCVPPCSAIPLLDKLELRIGTRGSFVAGAMTESFMCVTLAEARNLKTTMTHFA